MGMSEVTSLPPSPVTTAAASYSPPKMAVQAAIKDIRKVKSSGNGG